MPEGRVLVVEDQEDLREVMADTLHEFGYEVLQAGNGKEALEVLHGVEGIGFVTFDERDVVRHPLVQKIVGAYDRHGRRNGAVP